MLFESLDERTKQSYNRLLKTDEEFISSDLAKRVLLAQLDQHRSYDTWDMMLSQSVLDTMERIEANFMSIFRGYGLKQMLPSPNTEEKIVELFLANFRNVTVESDWDEESPDLEKYMRAIVTKYYLFLITIHANTSEEVRPGIVKAFADFIKDFEDSKVNDYNVYIEQFIKDGGVNKFK